MVSFSSVTWLTVSAQVLFVLQLIDRIIESQNVWVWKGPLWVIPLRRAARQQVSPSLYWCMGLFLPRCRTLHLPLLIFIRFLPTQLSSLSRSCWMAAQPSGVSTTPPSFVSSANLLRVCSVPSSRTSMNKRNKTGPRTEPWGTPLATGLRLDSALLITTL